MSEAIEALRAALQAARNLGEVEMDWLGTGSSSRLADEQRAAYLAKITAGEAALRSLGAPAAAVTHVCPSKDIVCGNRPVAWCATCPLRTAHADRMPVVEPTLNELQPRRREQPGRIPEWWPSWPDGSPL